MANLRSLLVVSFLIFTGCGLTLSKQSLASNTNQGKLSDPLSGEFQSVDGSKVNLLNDSSQIQILMFVSETCAVCRHETIGLVQNLKATGHPTNVKFYSVVVGSRLDDAQDWRDSVKADWTIGIQDGDALFRSFCPELQTPCVILKSATSNETTRLYGAHTPAEWEQITGQWSY